MNTPTQKTSILVRPIGLAGILLLVLLPGILICRAADFPAPSGRFTFEGKKQIGTATLNDSIITNSSLYVTGEYKWPPAVFRPLVLSYHRFTVVTKIRPDFVNYGATLLVGGTGHRWFIISANKDGKIELSFNNHAFRHPVEGLTITNGQWTTLALAFDLQAKRAVIYANGTRADEIVLPENFDLAVVNDMKWKESDKELTFTDGATGGTFRGLVAGLLTFDSILSPDQVRLLFPTKRR
jgi:hypothetical protein